MIERWLFGPESARRLRAVQFGLAGLLALRVALGPYRMLAGQPPEFFRPVWFLRLLPSMPPVGVIIALQVVGTLAAVAVFAAAGHGRTRRVAFAVAWACLVVLAGLRTSQGKFLHNDVLLVLACVPFLAAPTRDDDGSGWPVRTALVVVAGAYFFTGFHKLVTSGLAWVTSDNLVNVVTVGSRSGRVMFPAVGEFVARQAGVLHVVAAVVLLVELTFPVVLVRPRTRPYYAAAVVALHAGTWLLLGLDYWAWAAVSLVVLPDWTGGRRRRPGPGSPAPARAARPARRATVGTPAAPAPW